MTDLEITLLCAEAMGYDEYRENVERILLTRDAGIGTRHFDPLRNDAQALADTLECDVLPLFFHVDSASIPRGWIARVKRAIMTLGWMYNADRMVMDYARGAYLPAVGATHRPA